MAAFVWSLRLLIGVYPVCRCTSHIDPAEAIPVAGQKEVAVKNPAAAQAPAAKQAPATKEAASTAEV